MDLTKRETKSKGQRGRPISFDKSQLVLTVMEKFWQQGYHQVSLNEIAKDNGLTRASLYHSFHSKDSLFLTALRVYLASAPDAALDQPAHPAHVGNFFFTLLDNLARARASDPLRKGCLLCNCVNELIGSQGAVTEEVMALVTARKVHIAQLLERAIRLGELPDNTDIVLASNMFMNFLFGINTLSKTVADEHELKTLCEAFLNSLGFYRQDQLSQQVV